MEMMDKLTRYALSSSEGEGGTQPKPRRMEMQVEAGGEWLGGRMERELEKM